MEIKVDNTCFATENQRDVLLLLSGFNEIRENFFLTGGTALSVFYLHHRVSDDLDLFTVNEIDLSKLDFLLTRNLNERIKKINSTKHYLSLIIDDTKVDFVIDYVSNKNKREKYYFNEESFIRIDNMENISSNKLCVLVSRTEVKDYIDFFHICKNYDNDKLKIIYEEALKKDAVFEDSPTVAYQIEEGLKYVVNNQDLYPRLSVSIKQKEFEDFYKKLVDLIFLKDKK
ncbi:MAG: hypothetical protein EHM58_10850 [Ignavibacteriae bacterium]|nr:MAG: hypothetical protein EHM58_10850 [Ignavibacteriota bacterium]